MPTQLSIVAFTGSLREKSVNKGILRELEAMLPEHVHMEVLSIEELPYFDVDLEGHEPESVLSFREKIRQADAVFIAAPEFNGSIPGMLKNALDWVSRPFGQSVMAGKLTAMAGAGAREGTASAQEHLRTILTRFGVTILNAPTVTISNSWEKFDTEGNLQHEESRAQLRTLLNTFLAAIEVQKTASVG